MEFSLDINTLRSLVTLAAFVAFLGVVAWALAQNPAAVIALMRNPFAFWMIVLAQFGLVIWLSAGIMGMSLMTATAAFSVYATLNGVIFSTIFLAYTGASIASTFFVTAGTFAGISVYGFTTKRDLTSIGSMSMMALWGIIIASLVNIFFKNPVIYWFISYLGVAVFVGLTAYDTQRLKRIHEQGLQSGELLGKMALLGALALYLDFINLFLMLLRIFGRQRN